MVRYPKIEGGKILPWEKDSVEKGKKYGLAHLRLAAFYLKQGELKSFSRSAERLFNRLENFLKKNEDKQSEEG